MTDIHKTRFIAANYSNLQGLKAVPLGLLLILVAVWANGQGGGTADLLLPIAYMLGAAVLLWAVHRFYRTRYGKVETPSGLKRQELILGVVGGALGLGAFLVDAYYRLPFSVIGLAFAASVVVEYLRMRWRSAGHILLLITLTFTVLLLAVSILPLLGADGWWLRLGLRSQMLGVLVAAGAVSMGYGLVEHWFFVRQLPEGEGQP